MIALTRLCTIEPHSVHNSRVEENHYRNWEKCCERKPSKTVSFAHPLLRPHVNAVIYFPVKVLNHENWETYDNSKDPRKRYDHLEYQGKCMMQCTYFKYNTIQYNTIRYDTIPYHTIQYNTIQYNTIQYNTIQCEAMSVKNCLPW